MERDRIQQERVARLRTEIAEQRVLVVAGAGVSTAVTAGQAPSWVRLLEQGLERCEGLGVGKPGLLARQREALKDPEVSLLELFGVARVVTELLGGRGDLRYRNWLRETLGSLKPSTPEVAEALALWSAPIATTNYDTLIEEVTGRQARHWRHPEALLEELRRPAQHEAVLHLHGLWSEPESVVLDASSYEALLSDQAAQALQQAAGLLKTFVFVGCGDTLQDPNFGSLLAWSRKHFPKQQHRHFRLCLEKERQQREIEHAQDGIDVVVYGEKHEDLAPFLRGLAPKAETPAPLVPPPALPKTPEEIAALRRRYLSWVLHKHQQVRLPIPDASGGGGGETVLPLAGVYTALRTTRREEQGWVESGLLPEPEERRRLTALEALDRERLLVLLGDPGGGKSTFVAFLTACLAGEGVGEASANLAVLTAPLANPSDQKKPAADPWQHGALVPVPVVLRDFAARGGLAERRCSAKQLWEFVTGELAESGLEEAALVIDQELGTRGGLVLLDGLDEVPKAGGLRRWVSAAIEDFAACHPHCRFLVTSRTYAYRGQGWTLGGFAEAELAPFEDDQIKAFLHRWYQQVSQAGTVSSAEAKSRADELIPVATGQPRIRELAERPLLLSLMASLHYSRGRLPEDRAQLYKETVELLLDVWQARRRVLDGDGNPVVLEPSVSEWLKADRVRVRQALERLAFEAHTRQPELAGTADVPEEALVAALFRAGGATGPQENPANTALLVGYLSERAGLLLRRGDGVYTFPHRTLQEYLASRWLVEQEFPEGLAERARKDPDRWREVVLLAASSVRGVSQAVLWDFLDALCPWELPKEGKAALLEQQWGAQLAGLAAAESANLEQLPERLRPRLDRLRGWLLHVLTGHTLPARERALAGESLATLGDPRPEVMTLDAMQFCWVPAGKFVMGSEEHEWERPPHEVEIPYDYWLARYPVTVAQWRDYGAASGVEVVDEDSLRGSANTPVVDVSWHEALAFCRWLTERWNERGLLPPGWSVQLPSEAEWEKAARGDLELPVELRLLRVGEIEAAGPLEARQANTEPVRRFPWGDAEDPERANYDDTGVGGLSAVGAFAGGRGPHGSEELAGNVLEWTRSHWGRDFFRPLPYPYTAADGREELSVSDEVLRVLRGGGCGDPASGVRCACRGGGLPYVRDDVVGFRVLLSPHSPPASDR